MRAGLKQTAFGRAEVLNTRKDGSVFWSSASFLLQQPEEGTLLIGYHRDITARNRQKKTAAAAMVYENSSEAIAVTDANNQFIAVNPAFEK